MDNFDYIEGTKFIAVSDLQYCCDTNYYSHCVYKNTFTEINLNGIEKEVVIVYTNLQWTTNLFIELKKYKTDKKIILVTHNSDDEVNEKLFKEKPDNIIKWFSVNVNYIHPDLISIPIGLEHPNWHISDDKIKKIFQLLQKPKNIRNLLYINHSVITSLSERSLPYTIFKNKSWCTLVEGRNGQDFDKYINDMHSSKFVIAPKGNGIQCHREFEGWYVNTIPVFKANINNKFYQDLPCVYVKDWEEITEDFLNQEYQRIEENKKNGVYNMDKLTFTYWKDLIQSK